MSSLSKADSNAGTGRFLSFLTLFTSMGTLLCCALPALLVSLGMGAVLAGFLTEFPQLIWFSENKSIVFGVAGILLLASGILQYKMRNAPCPIDPKLRDACLYGRKYAFRVWSVAAILYMVGVLFAFVLPYV